MARESPGDELLMYLVHAYGFVTEDPFAGIDGDRRWRWDACLLGGDGGVAVEYQGKGPGHEWSGADNQWRKITEGQLCGITVVLCGSEMVNDGRCIEYVELAMQDAGLLPRAETERVRCGSAGE